MTKKKLRSINFSKKLNNPHLLISLIISTKIVYEELNYLSTLSLPTLVGPMFLLSLALRAVDISLNRA